MPLEAPRLSHFILHAGAAITGPSRSDGLMEYMTLVAA